MIEKHNINKLTGEINGYQNRTLDKFQRACPKRRDKAIGILTKGAGFLLIVVSRWAKRKTLSVHSVPLW